jgi:hypothetical protein
MIREQHPTEDKKEIGTMSFLRVRLQFTAFVVLLFLIACASTKFTIMWKDETYHGHPGKILVINTFPNPENRKLFEDELVQALKDHGVNAVASYALMPKPVISDMSTIAAKAKEVGADTVLINRAVGSSSNVAGGPGGVYYVDLFIKTQTDIYDMKSDSPIFSASAETWIRQGQPYSSRIHSYVTDLVNKLSQQGVF